MDQSNHRCSLNKFIENYGLPLFFLLIYLIFPTSNSTVDGWGYAEEIKYNYSLFRPHHLLYNAFGYILIKLINLFNFHPDVLSTMKIVNAVTAALILLSLGQIMIKMQVKAKERNCWLFFVGSSFGIWRFAAENEVYLIPIFLSLIGSFFFLTFLKNAKTKHLFFSSFFASLACLFHQIHIFWWLALLIGILLETQKWKNLIVYLSVAAIVPFTYFAVLIFHENKTLTFSNITFFILHDYLVGGAEASIDYRNFLLTPISLFRSFFQVHGNIIIQLKKFPWLYALALLSVILALRSLIMFKEIRLHKSPFKSTFIKALFSAFILHLLFAFFSHGNAEFMVVLLVLVPLITPRILQIPTKVLLPLSLSMFIWNFSFAIFPNYYFNYNNDEELIDYVHEHPEAIFILKDKNIICNRYFYETGVSINDRVFGFPLEKDLDKLCFLQNEGREIYSDIPSKKSPLSRATLLENNNADYLQIIESGSDTIPSFYGDYTIDKITVHCK